MDKFIGAFKLLVSELGFLKSEAADSVGAVGAAIATGIVAVESGFGPEVYVPIQVGIMLFGLKLFSSLRQTVEDEKVIDAMVARAEKAMGKKAEA